MAAESKEAALARQARRRALLSRGGIKSSDTYYASGQHSTQNPPTPPRGKTLPKKKHHLPPPPTDRVESSDKYYASAGTQKAKPAARATKPSKRRPAADGNRREKNGSLFVGAVEDASGCVRAAIEAYRKSPGLQTIIVASGRSDLLRRTRAVLDGSVTRGEITAEDYGQFRLVYEAAPVAAPSRPVLPPDVTPTDLPVDAVITPEPPMATPESATAAGETASENDTVEPPSSPEDLGDGLFDDEAETGKTPLATDAE